MHKNLLISFFSFTFAHYIIKKSKTMPVKILSVDDETDLELLLTQYFRREIRKGEYEFHFAHNGLELTCQRWTV